MVQSHAGRQRLALPRRRVLPQAPGSQGPPLGAALLSASPRGLCPPPAAMRVAPRDSGDEGVEGALAGKSSISGGQTGAGSHLRLGCTDSLRLLSPDSLPSSQLYPSSALLSESEKC